MSSIISIKLDNRGYKIIIGFNVIKKLGKLIRSLGLGDSAYIITNPLIKREYGSTISNPLRNSNINYIFDTVADSERSKSLSTSLRIIKDLARYDRMKRTLVIAFGGGVIGDLSGFVASIYKRGIPYIQIPTTLLSCVDSSVGGKTGVDLKLGKNLVGTFYQPKLIISELSFLKSLGLRQIRAGLAEVIKYAIIKDKNLFRYLECNYQHILNLERQAIEIIVSSCVKIKAKIVELDEREDKGIRTILNFGHTLGHAIETAGGYHKYNHGEAIALGMIAASRISRKLKLINRITLERIERLIGMVGLPTSIRSRISLKNIIGAYYRDKKFIGKTNRLVLIRGLGKTTIKQDLPINIIKDILIEMTYP